jgi:hypothetical protein
MSAYVIDQAATAPIPAGSCDTTDPRAWGGSFQTRDSMGNLTDVRCVPDMLNPKDMGMMFSFNVQVRAVFSEGLNGDAIETQDNIQLTSSLKDGVVTAMGPSGSAMVPIDRQTIGDPATVGTPSYYDPAGSDFKQGFYGTAPPGPAIVVTPGDAVSTVGLPSGGTSQVCFTNLVTDTGGTPLKDPKCVSITTQPFQVAGTTPAMGDMVPSDMVAQGLSVTFNAPVSNDKLTATNIKIRWNNSTTDLDPNCYMLTPDMGGAITMNSSTAVNIVPVLTAPCPLTAVPAGPAQLIIKGGITEQYGVQLGADNTVAFTVTPAGGGSDAGAP